MTDTLDVTFTSLSQLSRAYGTPAVDMAGRVLQRTAYAEILTGWLCSGAALIAFIISVVLLYILLKENHKNTRDQNSIIIGIVPVVAVISITALTVSTITAVTCLCDVWAWTALNDPNLALAHKIFGSMGG